LEVKIIDLVNLLAVHQDLQGTILFARGVELDDLSNVVPLAGLVGERATTKAVTVLLIADNTLLLAEVGFLLGLVNVSIHFTGTIGSPHEASAPAGVSIVSTRAFRVTTVQTHQLASLVEFESLGEVSIIGELNGFGRAGDLERSGIESNTANFVAVGRVPCSLGISNLHDILARVARVLNKVKVAVSARVLARLRVSPLVYIPCLFPRVAVMVVE
jgi:hypothetical protein